MQCIYQSVGVNYWSAEEEKNLSLFLSRSIMIDDDELKDELEIIQISIYMSFYLGRLVWYKRMSSKTS